MMEFEPNLSLLFSELPLLQRPAAAAAAGFKGAEMWWPFDGPEPPASQVDAVARAFEEADIRLALLNFDGGDIAAGDRGIVSDPAHVRRFRANVDVAIELARRLDCPTLNALYGNRVDGLRWEMQRDVALENLAFASAAAERIGARVVVEALNPEEHPRYGLHRRRDAIDLIDQLGRTSGGNVSFLFDVYHAQRSGDDLIETIVRDGSKIAHVQIADVPGRHEPGTGAIPFGAVLQALHDHGYDGWIGLEFIPSVDTSSALRCLEQPEFRVFRNRQT
jgi:hydroxypyruvate isomerase